MKKLVIAGIEILPGETRQIEIPVVKLCTNTDMSMPVYVVRSKKDGPTFFVSAAVHGDELNGIEIIRRLINLKRFKLLKGTLILVPMVNVYGVLNQSRYMPDRRDLNRCFPGSANGSLAGIMAHTFLKEIVSQCEYGIDLHTGAIHRSNLPQIRANLNDEETLSLAQAFAVPVLLNSTLRDGSLRQAAVEHGTRILLYEAGEALRFDELSIRAGVKGIQNVLSFLGMLGKIRRKNTVLPFIANTSAWLRANCSGVVFQVKKLGDRVKQGDCLAKISDPFGSLLGDIVANRDGIIIGNQNIPLVQQGEAMFHVAYFIDEDDGEIIEQLEKLQDDLLPEYVNLD
ncbi:succinylglutamate desuccinylase/aspartoacylase family protein [Shewanella sp. VB17]|uniref:succinylglutamate desuccinylase/aspartoacylase family protein n=1 Tax=Shewanella sp. VB17 TaxID=2739432 RepID=UPI0015648883|nr:succinylglutamate desuccinylase/aspartoacylase family protein [Shewanella sp. VB17]NRD74107.1 succinylglutamate desuccinylase/aspartoacylase family protein [Shewanella sp. VB17]